MTTDPPPACRGCYHPVPTGVTYDGYGPVCAERRGLLPHRVRVRAPVRTGGGAPVLDGLAELLDQRDQRGERKVTMTKAEVSRG
jgi:hypothetical protein